MGDAEMPRDTARPRQRHHARFPVLVVVRTRAPHVGGTHVTGVVRNLGAGGLLAELPVEVARGTRVGLTLETRAGPVALAGRVVWTVGGEGRVQHGMAFEEPAWFGGEGGRAVVPERRGTTRVGLRGRPTARAWDLLEVWLVDLSLTGVRITLGELLPPGSACTLTLPPALRSLTLPARVIWSASFDGEQTPEGGRHLLYQSGLAFVALPEEERATLASMLADLRAAGGLEETHQAP